MRRSTPARHPGRPTRALVARVMLMLGAMLLATTGTMLTPVAAAAEQTFLHTELSATGNTMVVRGSLFAAGSAGLPGRTVSVVGLGTTTAVTTGQNGWFDVSLPVPANHPAGTITVQTEFAGDQTYSRVTALTTTTLSRESSAHLSATANRTTAFPGDAILIAGALRDGAGQPIVGAIINSHFGDVTSDIFDLTDESGTFASMAQVPLDATPGVLTLSVRFAGDQVRQASLVTITVEIPQSPTPEPSPSETPSPSEITVSATPAVTRRCW